MTAPLAVSPRHQMSDVDAMIADLRACEHPHDVEVCGMLLHILPGVLSPRLSHAPDALISKWHIQSGATILDLGCGSGVLGLAALRAGAERLVALDINPQAVLTTKTNIERLGYSDHAEVRLSDIYSALQPKETFDLILFAAPYWNRKAKDDLERSCFDEGHSAMALWARACVAVSRIQGDRSNTIQGYAREIDPATGDVRVFMLSRSFCDVGSATTASSNAECSFDFVVT